MDAGRLLIPRHAVLVAAALALCGCSTLRAMVGGPAPSPTRAAATHSAAAPAAAPPVATPPRTYAVMAPIPNPTDRRAAPIAATEETAPAAARRVGRTGGSAHAMVGRAAIAEANASARETSRPEGFIGGMQVFAYQPGRVYEVWTAPLRVTTLTLSPGEAVVSKAAGDTVRWQIGETTSGQGPAQRAHVMIKPLERGLETNLVLATTQRVYLIQLRSGPTQSFNAAVGWDLGAALPPAESAQAEVAETSLPPLVAPVGPLDARYRIAPRGRRPAWTPTAVMTDGVRTFLTFPPDLGSHEAPGLFVVGPGGEAQLVNYRQQDGLWVVDRVFEEAELRVGDKHPQVVRVTRQVDRP